MATHGSVVGSPITPTLLAEMGALGNIPAATHDFDTGGDWTAIYRIWTCHGYRDSGNANQGFLRLKRETTTEPKTYRLIVDQEMRHDGANVQIFHAEIDCRNDAIGSPRTWTLDSRHLDWQGKPRDELARSECAVLDQGRLQYTSRSGVALQTARQVAAQTTSDWTLFDALQRMGKPFNVLGPFSVLEGLSIEKRDQSLRYRGRDSHATLLDGEPLHWIQQTGRGILPYEYWLNNAGRVLVAVTGSRAYILDDDAVELTRTKLVSSRQYELRRQQGEKKP